LPRNPLKDPKALKEADFVMKRGEVYVSGGTFVWKTPLKLDIVE
jgi:hypothetical protein